MVVQQNGRVADSRDLIGALTRAGIAEVDASRRRRAEYSSDASNYRVVPQVVVFPRDVDDVLAALATCRALSVPLTPRGAGTSIAGNAVGSGVVLDFSRHLNRVLEVDPEARTAVVEPGAVLDDITAAGAAHGLRFGPDPSTHSRATIGGSFGNNACGSRAMAYGRSGDNVVSLDVVTGGGARFTATTLDGGGPPLLGELDELVRDRLALIRTEFGRFARQVSGYSMEHLLPENGGNLAKFLVGTEGTLVTLLGATVRLVESPKAVALAVLGYPDMPAAAEAVPALLPHKPVALEGMDARLVAVVRSRRGAAAVPELPRGEGWLFVETAGATEAEARAAAEKLIADAGCLDSVVVTGAVAKALWRIREDGAGLGGRTPANEPAWPGWEDAAVPPARLGAYLREFAALMAEHGLDGLVYGHFGDGCVHARIDFPLQTDVAIFREFVTEAAKLVGEHGGSMSGEHGDGRARGELLPFMYSAEAIATFAAVKNLFDPANLLNPGVIVDPAPVDADLRVPAAKPLRKNLGFAYPHDGGDLSTAVHRCVGVGKCRADTTASGGVMCPSYLATRDEKDSTRGRARVLQELANGSLVKGFKSAEVAEALDLCLSCKGCAADCPAGVDMATYKAEALHQRYRRRLRPPSHYALGWLPRWARLASKAPRLANRALGNPWPRTRPSGWVASTPGARCRGLRARRSGSGSAATSAHARPSGRSRSGAALGRHVHRPLHPEVGQAAVRVLEDAGYSVRITGKPVCCGLTWISTGQLDGARKQLRATLDALEPALRAGIPIVGLEPSCTAVLRSEIAELLPDDPRAAKARAATKTLAELLAATEGWSPPRLDGVRGVAQPHCHQHAVMGWETDAALLADAGASVDAVGGCCGLAGNFGVERGHYEVSVAVAETALLPAVRAAPHDAVILADGFSCRTQLEQLGGVHSVHLAQLLADHLPRFRETPSGGGTPNTPAAGPSVMSGFVPPPYPYDRLDEVIALASRHEGGAVDLSIGTPCDPAPAEVIAALSNVDSARGYPPSIGTPALREAAAGWIARRLGATVDPATEVAACVGSKEFVASTPQYLKLRDPSRDTVLYPAISYPTYAMGATLAGCRAVAYRTLDEIADADAERALCVWVNSPGNPTGELHDLDAAAAWGRARNVPVLSDECYAEFTWSGGPTTILRSGTEGVHRRPLAVQARQLRRRPDRLLRRRSRAGALPARGAQARRTDAGRSGAERGDHRPRRRRARRGAAAALPRPAHPAARDPDCGGLPGRAAGRRVLPVGGRARWRRLGRRARSRPAGGHRRLARRVLRHRVGRLLPGRRRPARRAHRAGRAPPRLRVTPTSVLGLGSGDANGAPARRQWINGETCVTTGADLRC